MDAFVELAGAAVTLTVIVTGAAQGLPVGVNVYIFEPVTAVLISSGIHVPAIPLVDCSGNAGAVEF
jgi:hypothetical protein